VENMGWGWCGRGPYPGRGPWSWLPPWQRPGWYFGRGWCWWYLYWLYGPYWPYYPPGLTVSDLESYRKWLEEARARLDRELQELEKRIKELKEKGELK
jgi:glutathione S-transferase